MEKNKLTYKSSRDAHRFLIKEAYRIFLNKGYKCFVEAKISDEHPRMRADVLAIKGDERIIIECMVGPSRIWVEKKFKYKKYCDKFILCYPSKFIPTAYMKDIVDEEMVIELPEFIKNNIPEKILKISQELWIEIMQEKIKKDLKTGEDVIKLWRTNSN